MGKQALLLIRLEGPLQSWGLRSRWDVRDTGDEPSKSGVVGLLACALGYPVHDERLEALGSQLRMGARIENPGRRMVDFQTVSGVLPTADGGAKGSDEKPSTIPSPRAYLQDAAFLVVLGGPAEVLEQCRDALEKPRWPVFLGRKACPPTRPVLVALTTDYESVEDALRRHPWDWYGRGRDAKGPEVLWCVVESDGGSALRPDRMVPSPSRMYGMRAVEEFSVPFPGVEQMGETECDERCSSHA